MRYFTSVRLTLFCCVFTLAGLAAGGAVMADMVANYSVGSWAPELGNHRARIRVTGESDAVWVHIPWRRHDSAPQDKDIIIRDAATGKQIANVARVNVNRETADLVFQPATAPGVYEVYYMPFTANPANDAYAVTYATAQSQADAAWIDRNYLSSEGLLDAKWKSLPKAELIDIQARSEFHKVDPMEVIATQEETKALLKRFPGKSYLLFPEDRLYPVRMTEYIPHRWVQNGPGTEFHGTADRNEFYVFQIGVFAAGHAISNVKIVASGLKSKGGGEIAASAIHSFNTRGVDWLGQNITRTFTVDAGKVRPLWFGVQIPRNAKPGLYEGVVAVKPEASAETRVKIGIKVSNNVLEDSGDSELWRLTRLRWLDSTIGIDNQVTAPYTPVEVRGNQVKVLDREIKFAGTGLPGSIISRGREILAKPMDMVVETAQGTIHWNAVKNKIVGSSDAGVVRESESSGESLTLKCMTRTNYDGYINVHLTLTAKKAMDVKDIRLEIPIKREIATYMMGMGRKGGYRPTEWKWTWDINRANNTLWIGDVDAGLHFKLKNTKDSWEIYDLKKCGIPESWGNDGKGGCMVSESGDIVFVNAYTGERKLKSGEQVEFKLGFLITPVKPLNPDHWNQRYYHFYTQVVPVDDIARQGANIINIHHGNELNPHINYPFLTLDKLSAYVKQAHDKGCKAKLYYTVRELSNYTYEIWPLKSLGDEVFADGPGGGSTWLCEHFGSNYQSAWHQLLPDGEVDAAITTTGLSRWHNYYLEGLSWLIKNVSIDGLYLDGIGYDREVMKRLRRVMDDARSGCLLDFHSGNEYPFLDLRISPACKYMEHFPYIDSLWFGEGYDPNETPDYWLVEMSGIPYGLYSEMLSGGGNPWRGMLYGMTNRLGWFGDPRSVWKLWDAFGIKDAKMIGYWSPSCPVKTDNKDVLATAYCKEGKVLIALASWAKEPVKVRLNIDWKALGLDSDKVRLNAPAVEGLQTAQELQSSGEIPVEPGKGWMLILSENH